MGGHESTARRFAGEARRWSIGDHVLCPHQGIGTVGDRSVRTLLGRRAEYLTIRIAQTQTDITLPTTGEAYEALRPLPSAAEIMDALSVAAQDPVELGGTWNNRVKLYRSKLFSGELNQLAEVVRDLGHRSGRKALPASERALQQAATERFTLKAMHALDVDEQDARELLDTALQQPSAV